MKRIVTGALVAGAIAAVAFLALREPPVPVEMAKAATQTVREYIAEDGTTCLAEEYVIDMPISGTLQRIALEEGDRVEQGQCLARVDPFMLEQQINGAEALAAQARAQIVGVDVAKPKPEDLESAEVQVEELRDSEAITRRERAVVEINYKNALKEYERLKALHAEGAVSQSAFDEADRMYRSLEENRERAALAEAATRKAREVGELAAKRLHDSVDDNEFMRDVYLAELDRLEAELGLLKYDLEKATVEAPIAGVVLEKYVEDERALMAGTPLMKLGDLSAIEIESDILSEEVGRIEAGDPVEITGKALEGKTVMGSVKSIYPSGFKKISALGIEQQRVRILIDFDNTELALRPGTSVDVRVITAEHEGVVAVPERATFKYEGGWAVFAVRGRSAHLTPVEAGLRNDDWAEIISGIKAGEIIVADPKSELEDGAQVSAL